LSKVNGLNCERDAATKAIVVPLPAIAARIGARQTICVAIHATRTTKLATPPTIAARTTCAVRTGNVAQRPARLVRQAPTAAAQIPA